MAIMQTAHITAISEYTLYKIFSVFNDM